MCGMVEARDQIVVKLTHGCGLPGMEFGVELGISVRWRSPLDVIGLCVIFCCGPNLLHSAHECRSFSLNILDKTRFESEVVE
jgi:hypothetical protein